MNGLRQFFDSLAGRTLLLVSSLPRGVLVVGSWLVLSHALGACAAARESRTAPTGVSSAPAEEPRAGWSG